MKNETTIKIIGMAVSKILCSNPKSTPKVVLFFNISFAKEMRLDSTAIIMKLTHLDLRYPSL